MLPETHTVTTPMTATAERASTDFATEHAQRDALARHFPLFQPAVEPPWQVALLTPDAVQLPVGCVAEVVLRPVPVDISAGPLSADTFSPRPVLPETHTPTTPMTATTEFPRPAVELPRQVPLPTPAAMKLPAALGAADVAGVAETDANEANVAT